MGRPPTISREQILQASRAVFTQKGFASATLADIAGELGVTAAAVLRHFDSKQALFNAAMRGNVTLPDCILALETVDPASDPRLVLRRLAEQWLPFARTTIVQNLVLSMHERSNPTLVVPFDPRRQDSPPRRGLRIVTNYFKRARKARVIRVEDPRAAALLFMGSLVSYVFIHHVLTVAERPYPLDAYIDALIDLWSDGAIVSRQGGIRGRKKASSHAHRSDRGDRDRRDRAAAVHAAEEAAQTAGSVRDARSEDGQRRLTRRRTRVPRLRR
ncbi:MAG TPA: TetR/AcrR family transcriptional regulator [Thermoanaerobaculia bacterium]|nr:TetR/AcrR family transcriptional regulator [Thermoanaerobaculia bacterium]